MKTMPIEFVELFEQAEFCLSRGGSAEQVVVIADSDGKICCFMNHNITDGDTSDEKAFSELLSESGCKAVKNIVCMWRDGQVDVPSRHLINQLLLHDARNASAKVLLDSVSEYIAKEINALIPKRGI